MKDMQFCICRTCGNLVGMITNAGMPLTCCGEKMEILKPNTVDAASEKHVPHVTREGNKIVVQVGETAHPMTPEHYIEWIYLQTEDDGHRHRLHPHSSPTATFILDGEKEFSVFAYCNLHGLWKWDSKQG